MRNIAAVQDLVYMYVGLHVDLHRSMWIDLQIRGAVELYDPNLEISSGFITLGAQIINF